MRFITLLLLTFLNVSAYAGPAVIFSGSDVKTLKPNIDLNGQAKILSGSVDPSSVATSAPIGSMYLNASSGNWYRKTDAGLSTNWILQPNVSTPAYAGKQWIGTSTVTVNVGVSAAPSTTRTTLSNAGLATYTLLGIASNDSSTNFQVTASLPAGEYEVDFTAMLEAYTAASGTTTQCVFDIYDGTNVLGSATFQQATQAAAGIQDINHVRGYIKLASAGSKTILVRASKTAGDSSANSFCQAFVGNSATAMLTIVPRNQAVSYSGTVISDSAGAEKVARANITCVASPTINSQSGSWLSGITRNATGSCSIGINSGIFSAAPVCVVHLQGTGAQITDKGNTANTTTNVKINGYAAGGAAADYTADVICMGPK